MLHGDKPARRQAPKHQNKRSFHAMLPLVVLCGMVSAANPPAESSIGSTVDSRRIVNRPLSPASIRVSKRRGNLSYRATCPLSTKRPALPLQGRSGL